MKAFVCTDGGAYTCGGFGVSFAPKNVCWVWFGWGLGLGQAHMFCWLHSAIQVFEFQWVSRFLFPAVPTWTFNPHSGHGSELSAGSGIGWHQSLPFLLQHLVDCRTWACLECRGKNNENNVIIQHQLLDQRWSTVCRCFKKHRYAIWVMRQLS